MRYEQKMVGICPISTLWHVGMICALWLDLYWLSSVADRGQCSNPDRVVM
jgi:hypothetical protein